MTNACKKYLLLAAWGMSHLALSAQEWKPVEGKIMTQWSDKINPGKPLPEYPRPQLKRSNWQNLNGLWQYAITDTAQEMIPADFDGKILVPYPVESALSGVGKVVGKGKVLWYKTVVNLTRPSGTNQLLLHFGAVDWQCDVYVNGRKAGRHEGGFDPFSFNITSYLKKGKSQDIVLRVWDPTDEGPQPRGKQVSKPEGIWYTAVTGIWQTVWTETVPSAYIVSTKHTPDVDAGLVRVAAYTEGTQDADVVKFVAYEGSKQVGEVTLPPAVSGSIKIENAKLWSPAAPYLYTLKIFLYRNGKQIDYADSYFAMRKSSLKKDQAGINRITLNNEFVFQYGPLDQGWWPDGLFTAPTDEALLFDIIKTKEMGFNMIRKHIKLEPARWYYYCDSIGIMVWQDMPSGDMGGNRWDMRSGQVSGFNRDKQRSNESETYYRKEWKAILDAAYNFPSIVVWVPFNEAWGQFKTKEITEWTMKYDPSRLVNSASGGNFFYTGHILDIHHYPDPQMPDPEIFGNRGQALVLGEFGGLGLPVEGHTWQEKNNWGYQSFKNKEELLDRYKKLVTDLKRLIPLGLSAAVYTQTTDVEIETNGLLTYDRKVMKMPVAELSELHKALYEVPVEKQTTLTNPLLPSGADPYSFYKDGYYYYTHTTGKSLDLWKTKNMADLKTAQHKTVWTPLLGTLYSKQIWAPQIQFIQGKWYMYFAASDGSNNNHRMYVIENESADPLEGQWVFKGKVADTTDKWAIDADVFEHKEQLYMIWSGWEGDVNGQQNLYIARMKNPWTIESERVKISSPEYEWEKHGILKEGETNLVYVNEGPQSLKHKNKLFIVYSASGCWTDFYTLGMLSVDVDKDLLNAANWKKYPEPVFKAAPENGVYAAGHNSFFKSPDGKEDWILYHANSLPGQGCGGHRSPRAQKFTWNEDGTPDFGKPVSEKVKF